MTFAALKAEIISRTAKQSVIEEIQALVLAATYADLIAACKPLIHFLYLNGVLDTALLAEFTEADLNAEGIYTTGLFVLTDPLDVVILEGADVTVNMSGSNKCTVTHFGTVIAVVNCFDQSYVNLTTYKDAQINSDMNDESILNAFIRNTSEQRPVLHNNTLAEIHNMEEGVLDITVNDDTITTIRAFDISSSTYAINDAAWMNIVAEENVTLIGPPL